MSESPNGALTDEFWAWSLDAYARADVARRALALQDEAGANVNVLLACCWLAQTRGQALSPEALTGALTAMSDWSGAVTGPLRGVRRALKPRTEPGSQSLRDAVKESELAAERIEQAILCAALAPAPMTGTGTESVPDQPDHAAVLALRSLQTYAALLPQSHGDLTSTRELRAFVNAVFGLDG